MTEYINIDPKKWLGDTSIILMDWDCKAMHWHLMLFAWQNTPVCTIPNNDDFICKILNIVNNDDFQKRIKPQLLTAWKVKGKNLYQKGLLETHKKQTQSKTSKKKAVKEDTFEKISHIDLLNSSAESTGIVLDTLLYSKPEETILYEKTTKEEKDTIWKLGISLLMHEGTTEAKIRAFIGRLIKQYSDKKVAEAIGKLGAKSMPPVHAESYLIGILKAEGNKGNTNRIGNNNNRVNTKQNRGKVVI